ncbi:MAG: restriction endonuclease subunit S [Prevotella sp.]|nr:restriction endonuclease subunit S [Prevotella sp.]
MAEKEIILQGEDGQVDELVLTTTDASTDIALDDCTRLLFPQEGEAVPRLRFRGFEEKWIEAKLGDLFTERVECDADGEMLSVTMNNGVIKASDNGRYDNSNSDKSHYKVVKVNDIAYNSMRMWQGASGCSAYEGIVSPAYTVVTPVEGIDPHFFACLFKTPAVIKKFRLNSQGLTSDTWNLKFPAFSKISVLYPRDIDEQRKIASFLQRIDEQMTVYQKQFEELKQLKSACLETMFPQEEENVPAIRFEGFDKNWYKAKASELYETYNERNHPELPVLSACQDIRGMAVRSESGYDISHDRANEVTYKVVKPGQFVIHLRSFQGGFAHSAVEGITSPAYTVFGFKEPEKHDDYFWKTIFMSKDFINRLKTITYGIRDGRSISFSEFGDMELTFPEGEEQHRIASFFHSIDTQIAVQQQNLERLKQMKQSCLGLLFPDNQSITPPLRFKGFNGEWIMIRFSDIAQRISTSGVSDKLPSVEFEDIVSGEGVLNKDVSRKNVVKKGVKFEKHDVLFGKLRPYLKNILYADFNGIAVGDFWVLRASEAVDPYFLYILVSTHQFMSVANISSGSKMPRADWNLVSNSNFAIPSSIDEQRSIASFFRNLDGQINSKSQQVEKLKQVKKACLNQFIA